MEDTQVLVSILIPTYNDEEVLPHSLSRLKEILEDLKYKFEIIVVDDGSSDGTWEIIEQTYFKENQFRGLRFSRNFGQQAAIAAGLKEVSGQAAIIMDSDLQNPPELIPEFLRKWEEGYSVVYGIFQDTQYPFWRKISAWLFYNLLRWSTTISIPKNASDFSLMSRQVIDEINDIPEQRKFIRGLRAWVGFEQTGIHYKKPARKAGQSGYTYHKLLKLALNGLLSFSKFPLRFSMIAGTLIFGLGILYLVTPLYEGLIKGTSVNWHSLSSIDFLLSGIQLLVLGVIGEYVGRIYDETRQRPEYIVAETTDNPRD